MIRNQILCAGLILMLATSPAIAASATKKNITPEQMATANGLVNSVTPYAAAGKSNKTAPGAGQGQQKSDFYLLQNEQSADAAKTAEAAGGGKETGPQKPSKAASFEGKNERTVTVLPEVAFPVELSSSDVNRIACPNETTVQDIVYSKEKGVLVKFSGANAFIKFLFKVQNGNEVYASKPVEFYIVCGDNVYNLIGLPKRIPSQTIRLSSGKLKTIKANASLFGGLPLEKKMLKLIQLTYTDSIPDSFDVQTPNKRIKAFKDMKMMLKRVVTVEGEGFRLKEFYVTNMKSAAKTDDTDIVLNEKDFLNTDITTNTLAVSLDRLNLKAGESSRLFIVESTGGSNGNQ